MTIGVVLATFNGIRFIQEQLDSIINQTVTVDEIVISDDGSADGTFDFLIDYQNKHSNKKIVIVKNPKSGIVNNFYNAILYTNSDIIFFADQDDIWFENKIELFLHEISHFPNCGLFFSNADLLRYPDNTVIGTCWDWYFPNRDKLLGDNSVCGTVLNQSKLIDLLLEHGHNIVTGMCMAVKKDLLSCIASSDCMCLHDDQITCYAALNSNVCAVNSSTAYYRQHDKNVVGGIKSDSKLHFQLRAKNHFDNFITSFLHFKQLYIYNCNHRWKSIDKTYYKYYASFCLLKRRKISMIKYLISLVIAGKYTPCLFGVKKYSWFKGLISDCLMILFLKKKDKEAVLEKYHLTVSGV